MACVEKSVRFKKIKFFWREIQTTVKVSLSLKDDMRAFKNMCYSVPDEEQAVQAPQAAEAIEAQAPGEPGDPSDQCSDENIDNYVSMLIVISFLLSGIIFFFLIFALLKRFIDHGTDHIFN